MVVVLILIPFAAHALWDFVEVRRLVREIEAIREKGEPVTAREAGRGAIRGNDEHRRASRYYLAAAMLALEMRRLPEVTELQEWLSGATPLRTSPHDLANRLEKILDDGRDALSLLDSANRLDFNGFDLGTEYSYRTSGLFSLSHLAVARTLYFSLLGDGQRGSDSVFASLKMRRALRGDTWFRPRGELQIPALLSLSAPAAETLSRLQAALAAEEATHRPEDEIAAQRALMLERIWNRYYGIDPRAPRNYSLPMRGILEWMWRPRFTHAFVETLHAWAELLEAARKPWPEKIKATTDVARRYPIDPRAKPGRWPGPADLMRNIMHLRSEGVDASALVADRCSRTALAVERFRRDHGGALPRDLSDVVPRYLDAVPVDPISGKSLLYRRVTDAYVIYSVGADERDDGGDLSSELQEVIERGWGQRLIRGRDIGVRIVIR